MTTATADTQRRIEHLEAEKADYDSELRRTLSRLDVLRREVRESGPSAARAQQVRELEADETRLRGLLAQIERDTEAAHVSLRNATVQAQDEADLARIRHALVVEAQTERTHGERLAALAAVEPHLLATVYALQAQAAARVQAKTALDAIMKRHGTVSPDILPGRELDTARERWIAELGLPVSLFEPVVRPGLPVLAWPVIPAEAEAVSA